MVPSPQPEPERLAASLRDPELAALFPGSFLRLTARFDALVNAACRAVLEGVGAWPDEGGVDPDALAEARAVPGRARGPLRYCFRKLRDSGLLREAGGSFVPAGAGPSPFAPLFRSFVEAAPEAASSAEIVSILVEQSPAFFAGTMTGEEILFSPSRLPLWFRYFSNANPLYAVNNHLGALVLGRRLAGPDATVVEVGGGAGSAAEAALPRLAGKISRYRFTEVVPTFLRRGERAARAVAPPGIRVEASRLDMTRPWAAQGIDAASCEAVYSVNCFHVAPDLDAVLAEAFAALAPGGLLVLSECVKPGNPFRPIYVDFIFEFLSSFSNVRTHPIRRPASGFLSPAAWRESLAAAGFADVEVTPDVESLAADYPDFFVAAVSARRP